MMIMMIMMMIITVLHLGLKLKNDMIGKKSLIKKRFIVFQSLGFVPIDIRMYYITNKMIKSYH